MSLRKNVLANYLSQFYITAVGFITVPIYLKISGADTYGLISVFSTIQALFALLDVGLSPTLARDSARLKSGNITGTEFERTFSAISFVFFSIGLLGSITVFLTAQPIANHWLKSNQLSADLIRQCIEIMSIGIISRWQSGLYRGVITGQEKLVWVSTVNSIVATLRFIASIPLLAYATDISWFFAYQTALALAELIVLKKKALAVTGTTKSYPKPHEFRSKILTPLREKAQFSVSLAFTSGLWILVTQADKVVLSGLLSLEQYAYFTQAALAASTILMLSTPITSAFIPRIVGLGGNENRQEQLVLYRRLTTLVASVVFPFAVTLALCSREILEVWTQDKTAADQAHTILSLYAIGYALLSLSSLAAHLQVASGKLELHIKGSMLYALLFFTQLVPLTLSLGTTGAGIAWLSTNTLFLLGWIPYVHAQYMPKQHISWLREEIAPALLQSCIPAVSIYIATTAIEPIESNILKISATATGSILVAASIKISIWLRRK